MGAKCVFVCARLSGGIRGLLSLALPRSKYSPTFKGHASANEAVKDGRFIAAKKWQTNLLEQTWEDAPKMPLGETKRERERESGLKNKMLHFLILLRSGLPCVFAQFRGQV